MKRREFIALLGGAAAWPLAVRAQQPAMPVVGFLHLASAHSYEQFVAAFRQGLNEGGYIEGQNVAIEYRWAEGQYVRLPALASELISRRVAVIVAGGGDGPVQAAKAATTTIPIVFTGSNDPVRSGYVASFNRPGGNITGVGLFNSQLEAKKFALLRELAPTIPRVAMLVNPSNSTVETDVANAEAAARAVGQQINVLRAANEREIDQAFRTMAQQPSAALLVAHDPLFNSRREQLVTLAAYLAIPAIYETREFVAAGGLMSYGSKLTDNYRLAGLYAGRILKGAKPGELPVQQPTKFELMINLKTAKALKLEIPPKLLALVDEVIE